MSKDWIKPCPSCQSDQVIVIGKRVYFKLGAGLAVLSIIIGLIFPAAIAGVFAGVGLMILSPFIPVTYQCKSCRENWRSYKKN